MKNEQIEKPTKKVVNFLKKILQSKEMLCANYAYDYEKNHQDSSGHNFKKIWNDLEDDEKRVVIRYFYSLNNYEMLKEVNLIENPSEIQQIISDFIKNQYFDDIDTKQNVKKMNIK